MKLSIIYGLLLLYLIFPPPLFSLEINTYSSKTTVPVTNNDIDFVRNQAFENLKKRLLIMAVEDIVNPLLLDEYSDQISESKKLKPIDYLLSLKILDESADDNNFTMELEGKIRVDHLKEALRGMDFVLKNDPRVSVTLLADKSLRIPLEDFKSRLRLFHIDVSFFKYVQLEESRQNMGVPEFVKALFHRFPVNRVIFLADVSLPQNPGDVRKLRLSIFKKSGFQKLGEISLAPDPPDGSLPELFPEFLKLFSASSLKRSAYYYGSELVFDFEIKGIGSPFLRHVFESKILKANSHIKYFQVVKLSSELIGYRVKSDYDIFAFIKDFKTENPYFHFKTQNDDYNLLTIEAVYKLSRKATELREVRVEKTLLEMIQEALPEDNKLSEEDLERGDNVFLAEREPNNDSRTFNGLPPSTLVLGKLSFRGDNDVYQLQIDGEASEITIDWILAGKTAFSPQLRLYDENFSPLHSYSLGKPGDKIIFKVPEDRGSSIIYLRICDKVGFIQGETGGSKFFYYLLQYY